MNYLKNKIKRLLYKINGFDKYRKYNDYHWRMYRRNKIYKTIVDNSIKELEKICDTKDLIADVGCGDGLVSGILSDKGFYVLGFDNDDSGLRIARDKVPGADFVKLDLNKANVKNIDFVYSLNTIEHLKNLDHFVQSLKNANKGFVVVTDNAKMSSGDEEYHEREFTIEELEKITGGKRFNTGSDLFIGVVSE